LLRHGIDLKKAEAEGKRATKPNKKQKRRER
jgi:hypothetical protein